MERGHGSETPGGTAPPDRRRRDDTTGGDDSLSPPPVGEASGRTGIAGQPPQPFPNVPAKGAEFDVMIETRDAQHTQEVMDALRERGYPPRVV